MIEIPLYIMLIIYAVFVVIFLIFALINIYHMVTFGFISFESFFMTFLLLAGTILILFTTYTYAQEIDWEETFVIKTDVVELDLGSSEFD